MVREFTRTPAVSKVCIPASYAALMCLMPSSSGMTQSCHSELPYDMHPRIILDTFKPDLPKRTIHRRTQHKTGSKYERRTIRHVRLAWYNGGRHGGSKACCRWEELKVNRSEFPSLYNNPGGPSHTGQSNIYFENPWCERTIPSSFCHHPCNWLGKALRNRLASTTLRHCHNVVTHLLCDVSCSEVDSKPLAVYSGCDCSNSSCSGRWILFPTAKSSPCGHPGRPDTSPGVRQNTGFVVVVVERGQEHSGRCHRDGRRFTPWQH